MSFALLQGRAFQSASHRGAHSFCPADTIWDCGMKLSSAILAHIKAVSAMLRSSGLMASPSAADRGSFLKHRPPRVPVLPRVLPWLPAACAALPGPTLRPPPASPLPLAFSSSQPRGHAPLTPEGLAFISQRASELSPSHRTLHLPHGLHSLPTNQGQGLCWELGLAHSMKPHIS